MFQIGELPDTDDPTELRKAFYELRAHCEQLFTRVQEVDNEIAQARTIFETGRTELKGQFDKAIAEIQADAVRYRFLRMYNVKVPRIRLEAKGKVLDYDVDKYVQRHNESVREQQRAQQTINGKEH